MVKDDPRAEFLDCTMTSTEKQPANSVTDPDALVKLLEMELSRKRAAWQRTRSRRGTWCALSILFLFLVIAGALVAYFYFAPTLIRRGETEIKTADPIR